MLPEVLQSAPAGRPLNLRRKIYEYLLEEQDKRRQLPSQDDIRRVFGSLTEDVDLHLQTLVHEGLVILDKDGGNGISLVPTYIPAPQVDLIGRVAQRLTKTAPSLCSWSIALDLRGIGIPLEPGMFAVQVLDDRMYDAGIEYGDIALLVNTTPLRGDIVAVEEGEVLVLRRYVIVSGIPHFLAENAQSPDLRLGWESPMHGVLWGLIRADPCRRSPRGSDTKPAAQPTRSATQGTILPAPSKGTKPSKGGRENQPENWPEPPSGLQLNESRVGHSLTEERSPYDTWGPSHLSE